MNIPYCFKMCTKCGKWLVANTYNFYKHKTNKSGLEGKCKECKNKIFRDKYASDEEFRKEKYKKNRARYKYRYDNDEEFRDRLNKKRRDKYASDEEFRKERIRKESERHKYKYDNDEEYRKRKNENYKEWSKNNPEKEFNKKNRRRQKIENQGRGITKEQYVECNNWFDWKCAYSGEKLKQENSTYGRTLDHIIAIDNGGVNEPWNVIPMRKKYNSSKINRIDVMNWYKEQEYFDEERLNKIVEWQIYAYEKWGGEEFGELILITDLIEGE